MLGFMRARNEATSLSVSDRFISAAMRLSWSGVGRETDMASSFSSGGNPLRELLSQAHPGGRTHGHALGVEVAGGEVAGAHLAQLRLDFATDVPDVRLTARVEAAPRRRVERARNLAAQDDLLALPLDVGIGRGDRRDQRFAVR